MRIAVLIKQILDPAGIVVRRDKERIFVNVEEYIINPGDKNALEAALQIKDDTFETEVVAVCLGPPRADDALREALAMGADAAYLLSDELFEQVDQTGTARVLATALEKVDPDLVIAGRVIGKRGVGQIGPRIAERLDLAQITDVHELAVVDGTVKATRRWGQGYATVIAPLPALITMAPAANNPRYPNGARIMSAYREWEVLVWDATELGLDEVDLAPRIVFRSQSFAPPLEVGEVIRGDAAEAARELLAILKSQRILGDHQSPADEGGN